MECHAVHFSEPRIFIITLKKCQLARSLVVIDVLMLDIPRIPANGQKVIVHESAGAERLIDETCLRFIRIDTKLVALNRFHDLTSFAISAIAFEIKLLIINAFLVDD